jgi:hypothetical protein
MSKKFQYGGTMVHATVEFLHGAIEFAVEHTMTKRWSKLIPTPALDKDIEQALEEQEEVLQKLYHDKKVCMCGKEATGVVIEYHKSHQPEYRYSILYTTDDAKEGCCSFYDGAYETKEENVREAEEEAKRIGVQYLGIINGED